MVSLQLLTIRIILQKQLFKRMNMNIRKKKLEMMSLGCLTVKCCIALTAFFLFSTAMKGQNPYLPCHSYLVQS